MKTNKVISLFVVAFMLLTVMAVPALAEAKDYTFSLTGNTVAKYEGTYEVTVNIDSSGKNMMGVGFYLSYNKDLFDYTSFTKVTTATANATNDAEAGLVTCKSVMDSQAYSGAWGKLTFTAKAGTDSADAAFQCVVNPTGGCADAGGVKIDASAIDFGEALNIKVVSVHTAPTITGVTVTSPAVVGTELTAATEGFVDSWGLADASTFVWTIDGETVSTTNKYTPAVKDINKTITVTATPAVEAQEGMEEGTDVNAAGAKSTTAKVVIPADYAPTVAITIGTEGEVLAVVPVEPKATFEESYKAVTNYDVDYTYYVVPAELVAEADDKLAAAETAVTEATEGVITLESNSYSADYRDDYAVVKAEATYTIAGEAHATKPVDYAAALIKGEPPVIDASGIDTEVKLTVGKTLKTDAVKIDAKMPVGAEGTQEAATSYAWYALDVNEDVTEETVAVGTENKLKLTNDMRDKKIVLIIDYTNELGIPAETAVVSYAGTVQKASGSATQGGASLVTGGSQGGTVVEPEKPGTDEPSVDEKNPQDPAGEANDKGATVFTDVDKEAYAWAYEGIDALTKAGVIKGMTETTFGPELTATNAQMIALAVRIAGLTAEGATTDKVDAEHWVAAELAVADAKGILGVYGDKIDVEGATSREIAFTLLYNALKAAGVELAETAEAIEFTDAASIDANCVEAINALVKAGIVNGMGDGTLAPKATLTRAQLAKILGMANALVTK